MIGDGHVPNRFLDLCHVSLFFWVQFVVSLVQFGPKHRAAGLSGWMASALKGFAWSSALGFSAVRPGVSVIDVIAPLQKSKGLDQTRWVFGARKSFIDRDRASYMLARDQQTILAYLPVITKHLVSAVDSIKIVRISG